METTTNTEPEQGNSSDRYWNRLNADWAAVRNSEAKKAEREAKRAAWRNAS